MSLSVHPHVSFSPGTFTLFIAPAGILDAALISLIHRHRGIILYVCGNYPALLPGLGPVPGRLRARRALTAYQLLSIIEDADESLILFEHDHSLFEDAPDLISPVGEMLRQRATEAGTVILFSTRTDRSLDTMERYADRLAIIQETRPGLPALPRRSGAGTRQQTLTGILRENED